MRSLDYQAAVEQEAQSSHDSAFILELGPVELEPISYSMLVGLEDRLDVVCELLDVCFVDRPVMWADPVAIHPGSLRDRLSEIEVLLEALDVRLKASQRENDQLLASLVELWLDMTVDAVSRLETAEAGDDARSTRSVLTDYRCSVFAYVEALSQLLPEEYECAVQAREKLEMGERNLVDDLGVAVELIARARWRVERRSPEEVGFVTWGIP